MTKTKAQKQRAKRAKQQPVKQPPMRVQVRGNEVAPYIDTSAPQLSSGLSGNVRIRNREIVLTLSGTATAGAIPALTANSILGFQSAGYMFGSGSTTWLKNLGISYDRFKIINLSFMFQPILPVTTSGVVGMYWDADPTDNTAASYASVSAQYKAVTGSVFEPIKMRLTKDQLDRLPYYITTSTFAAAPVVTVSPGFIGIATSSIVLANSAATGSTVIGYIWAEYDMELSIPTA